MSKSSCLCWLWRGICALRLLKAIFLLYKRRARARDHFALAWGDVTEHIPLLYPTSGTNHHHGNEHWGEEESALWGEQRDQAWAGWPRGQRLRLQSDFQDQCVKLHACVICLSVKLADVKSLSEAVCVCEASFCEPLWVVKSLSVNPCVLWKVSLWSSLRVKSLSAKCCVSEISLCNAFFLRKFSICEALYVREKSLSLCEPLYMWKVSLREALYVKSLSLCEALHVELRMRSSVCESPCVCMTLNTCLRHWRGGGLV